jgi:predicted kinase
MDGCRQDSIHHQEGDVLVHTRMVVEALTADSAWRHLDRLSRDILFAAAVLHDAGKPAVTVEENGRISSRGHSVRGMRMARRMLYRGEGVAPAPFAVRQEIAALVRFHGAPLHALDRANPDRAAISLSQVVRNDRLAVLAEADIRGRICEDRQEMLDRVELFRELCRETGCFNLAFPFLSELARFAFLSGRSEDLSYTPFDDSRCDVVVMSGLPGAGKSTWVETQLAGWPVIRLDDLRRQLRVGPGDDQGAVVMRAKELAREHLRAGRSFVWDATNVSRAMRGQLVSLFTAYGARVRIVYVESPYAEVIRRNCTRMMPVPDALIERLIDRLDLPGLDEAHQVEWVVNAG